MDEQTLHALLSKEYGGQCWGAPASRCAEHQDMVVTVRYADPTDIVEGLVGTVTAGSMELDHEPAVSGMF